MSMTTTTTTMTITAAAASTPLTASAGASEAHRAAAGGICAGKLSLSAATHRACNDLGGSVSSISSASTATAPDTCGAPIDGTSAWWLSSDAEHAHTACPLRPFAHMVVALSPSGGSGGSACDAESKSCDQDPCTPSDAIPAASLASSRIVHMSDALRRKMHGVAPDARTNATVGELLAFGGERRTRGVGAGLWGVLGWLVGAAADDADTGEEQRAEHAGAGDPRPRRRRPVARSAEDDPCLVGNEGLGCVELACVRMVAGGNGGGRCVFALCAHALSPQGRAEWLAWRGGRTQQEGDGGALAVVHVAEVSILHRVAQGGLDVLVPPPLPQLEQSFAPLLAPGGRVLGPPPPMPAFAASDTCDPGDAAATRWLALLVSRHGLVEMAHPLAPTRLTPQDASEPGCLVALGGWLGESLFARIHPDDVLRLVRALRLAWDARPDAYHFARLRRVWQQRRRSGGAAERVHVPDRRTVLRADGIAVANGVVELNVQLRMSGAPLLDWDDAEQTAEHSRFACVRLSRWPLVLRPPRASSSASSASSSAEPSDGFVLVAMQPLPEPSAARTQSPPPPPPHFSRSRSCVPRTRSCSAADPAKHSIASVASTMTLVGLPSSATAAAAAASAAQELPELDGLCRSASCLSCHDATARPSVAANVPLPLPIRPHMAARRRSNIPVGSLGASADGLAYATPRDLLTEPQQPSSSES